MLKDFSELLIPYMHYDSPKRGNQYSIPQIYLTLGHSIQQKHISFIKKILRRQMGKGLYRDVHIARRMIS